MDIAPLIDQINTTTLAHPVKTGLKVGVSSIVFGAIILAPAPNGLTGEGQRAFAVMAFAVMLWITDALPIAVTGLASVVLLVLAKGVSNVEEALFGFSSPVTYFLIGILALGLAVHRSGLAETLAVYIIRSARGTPECYTPRCCSPLLL